MALTILLLTFGTWMKSHGTADARLFLHWLPAILVLAGAAFLHLEPQPEERLAIPRTPR